MLRERGRENKLKKRRFHIGATNIREGARSEVSVYTPDTKTKISQSIDIVTQTELSIPIWGKQKLNLDSSDRTTRTSTRFNEIYSLKNKEVTVFNKALKDLVSSGAISASILPILKEGFEDCLKAALDVEQSKSHKLNTEITTLKSTLATVTNQLNDYKDRFENLESLHKSCVDNENKLIKEIDNLKYENNKITEAKVVLLDDIVTFKKENEELQAKNRSLLEELEFLKQREIERIQQLDLDDIGLISQDSSLSGFPKPNQKNISKPNPLVPKLDFTKIFELRDRENEDEHVKEIRRVIRQELDEEGDLEIRKDFVDPSIDPNNYEEPTSLDSDYKQFYPAGEIMNSSRTISVIRKDELAKRKAGVIDQLNETYTGDESSEGEEAESSLGYYEAADDTGRYFSI